MIGIRFSANNREARFRSRSASSIRGSHVICRRTCSTRFAYVGRTFILDVHVELADAWRQQKVHDGAIIRKLAAREHDLIRALRPRRRWRNEQ